MLDVTVFLNLCLFVGFWSWSSFERSANLINESHSKQRWINESRAEICNGYCKVNRLRLMVYLQVNALSERIIRIYLHEFTNNERENSIPHEAAECGIENFEFIVSERMQVNPDNSRAMSALTFLLFKLNTLQTKIVKLWVSRSHGVMTVVYWIYTTAITPR